MLLDPELHYLDNAATTMVDPVSYTHLTLPTN